MMNFDDKYTKESEEKFLKYLKQVRKINPDDLKTAEEQLLSLSDLLNEIQSKPDKTPDDIELLANLGLQLKEISQHLDDIKMILDVTLSRKARAFYENVKKLAKEGDKNAEKIYNDLKEDFEKFDVN